jgi:hypothetical protein
MLKNSYQGKDVEKLNIRYSELEKTAEKEIEKFNLNGGEGKYSIGVRISPTLFLINKKGHGSNIASVFFEPRRIAYYFPDEKDEDLMKKITEKFDEEYGETWKYEQQE